MVFLVDHRNRLPLDSATASTALLALPMARPIRSGIEPRHAWRFYAVVVDVDEVTGNADTIEARRYQSGYNKKPFRAVAASYVGGQATQVTAVLRSTDAIIVYAGSVP